MSLLHAAGVAAAVIAYLAAVSCFTIAAFFVSPLAALALLFFLLLTPCIYAVSN